MVICQFLAQNIKIPRSGSGHGKYRKTVMCLDEKLVCFALACPKNMSRCHHACLMCSFHSHQSREFCPRQVAYCQRQDLETLCMRVHRIYSLYIVCAVSMYLPKVRIFRSPVFTRSPELSGACTCTLPPNITTWHSVE